VSFEDFIQKSMKGLLGLGFKDFWAYYPTTLLFTRLLAKVLGRMAQVGKRGE
jgi:hypothetical protein